MRKATVSDKRSAFVSSVSLPFGELVEKPNPEPKRQKMGGFKVFWKRFSHKHSPNSEGMLFLLTPSCSSLE